MSITTAGDILARDPATRDVLARLTQAQRAEAFDFLLAQGEVPEATLPEYLDAAICWAVEEVPEDE